MTWTQLLTMRNSRFRRSSGSSAPSSGAVGTAAAAISAMRPAASRSGARQHSAAITRFWRSFRLMVARTTSPRAARSNSAPTREASSGVGVSGAICEKWRPTISCGSMPAAARAVAFAIRRLPCASKIPMKTWLDPSHACQDAPAGEDGASAGGLSFSRKSLHSLRDGREAGASCLIPSLIPGGRQVNTGHGGTATGWCGAHSKVISTLADPDDVEGFP